MTTILEIARYNLAVAKENLEARTKRPREDAFWDLDYVAGTEDVAKWERVVLRLELAEANHESPRA